MRLYPARENSKSRNVTSLENALDVLVNDYSVESRDAQELFVLGDETTYLYLIAVYKNVLTPKRLRKFHRELYWSTLGVTLLPVAGVVILALFFSQDLTSRGIAMGLFATVMFGVFLIYRKQATAAKTETFVNKAIAAIEPSLQARGLSEVDADYYSEKS